MNATLVKDAATETYKDVHKLICHTVHGFISRYGTRWGDFEELYALANYEYMMAFKKYDPNRKMSFSSWCRFAVHNGLLEHQRTIIRRSKQCKVTVMDMVDDLNAAPEHNFNLFEFQDELSSDAKYVVDLTLDTPITLLECIRERKGNPSANTRSVIREYLEGMGWTKAHINAIYKEIADALES